MAAWVGASGVLASSRPTPAGGECGLPLADVFSLVAVPYRERVRSRGMPTMHVCWTSVRTRILLSRPAINIIWETDGAWWSNIRWMSMYRMEITLACLEINNRVSSVIRQDILRWRDWETDLAVGEDAVLPVLKLLRQDFEEVARARLRDVAHKAMGMVEHHTKSVGLNRDASKPAGDARRLLDALVVVLELHRESAQDAPMEFSDEFACHVGVRNGLEEQRDRGRTPAP